MHKIILVLFPFLFVAFNMAGQVSNVVPDSLSPMTTAKKTVANPPAPITLADNAKTERDTCLFYANFNAFTTDFVGVITNGTDLANAYLYTRCDCESKTVLPKPGENFILAATHNVAMRLVYTPSLTGLRMVWIGNTAKFLITRKE